MTESSGQLAEALRRFIADPPWLPRSGVVGAGARPAERVAFEPGLSDAEFDRIETSFRFEFPPDLRAMLASALAVSDGFPNWRSADAEELEVALDWPAEGICFDVERNGFWLETWGARPLNVDDACTIAREHLADAPPLIPIFRHRYFPSQPAETGNPVLSTHQSDIIYYGLDLPDYLDREFGPSQARGPIIGARYVPFWSDLIT